MIDTIVFDFDGTLVDFVNTDISALQMLSLSIDKNIDKDLFVETAIVKIMDFHSLVDKKMVNPLQMHEYRLRETLEKFGVVYSEKHLELYRSVIINNCKPYKGIIRLLKLLKVNYKIGLLSNSYDVAEQKFRIENSGLKKYFDEIVISGEIGIYKPNPEIFKYILGKMGSFPLNSLFVGDSIPHDIEGAKKAGMKTALITDYIQEYNSSPSDYLIERINIDVKKLLKKIQEEI